MLILGIQPRQNMRGKRRVNPTTSPPLNEIDLFHFDLGESLKHSARADWGPRLLVCTRSAQPPINMKGNFQV